jgi:5'-deoxy-5'-methylthioadenosine phosphorylase
MTSLAVIGGTGTSSLAEFRERDRIQPETPFGTTSAPLSEGELAGHACLFLPRHGKPHRIAPHRINYRANIWALREAGVEQVLAINAVGGIQPMLVPGELVIPDQLVDYSYGREHTFYDGRGAGLPADALEHIDFTEPYDRDMRRLLVQLAGGQNVPHTAAGTLAVTQGPRLETAAEVQRLRGDGCDVVGMTGMPEAALARELGLRYASICVVVNPAAGLSDAPITLDSMRGALARGADQVARLLRAYLEAGGAPAG